MGSSEASKHKHMQAGEAVGAGVAKGKGTAVCAVMMQVCEEAATALAKVDCSLVTRWRPGLQAEINRARAALQLPAREIQPPATSL